MRERIAYIFSIIGSFFLGILVMMAYNYFFPQNTVSNELKNVNIFEESNSINTAINKVYDGVVVIESYKGSKLDSSGTGFVYRKDSEFGYIITNNHVIENASSIMVINTRGDAIEAKLLGVDVYADIAVLSIAENHVLKTLEIGDSTKSLLGDTVFTVGTPVGSEYLGTITKGILSGKNRTVDVTLNNTSFMLEVLQTDAAINPGNSGGPLVSMDGKVIGVNSVKLIDANIEGMGFAIPIEIVMATVDRLEKGEFLKRPLFGAEMIDVSNTYSLYKNNIYLPDKITTGAVISSVSNDSVAFKSGLKRGDVIISINGVKIKSLAHFRFILYKCSIGDTVKLEYYRNEIIETVGVKLTDAIE